ncbi:MAG: ketoacyl-ACP synthase III [Spirochaetales bacterium]|jgi:3-oxoacyl-[acyl-carrier-protein] synthase-3|nr:ketoacyl-ACP synthase III [Spirochaetales bacterium]
MKAYIKGIGSCVPARKVSNDDLAKTVDTSDEWIYSHTGIRNRHIVEEGEAASDLALGAALAALKDSGESAATVDMILVATVTPDYPGFPSTACVVQDRLGARNAAAMDISAACSGFVYGLEMARVFIEGGVYKNVLVIGAETLSRITNWKDRNTCVLFGDGAGAALVSAVDGTGEGTVGGGGRGIIVSHLEADGSGGSALIRPDGGSRNPFAPDRAPGDTLFLRMDGGKVYRFAVDALGRVGEILLAKAALDISSIDFIVPHQANIRIIEACAKRLSLPLDKFYINIQEFANTSSASIPIALADMKQKGILKAGQLIMTVAFGAGLTCGGNIIRW